MKPLGPHDKPHFPDFLLRLGSTDAREKWIERAAIIEEGDRVSREEAERRAINEYIQERSKK